MRIAIVGVTGLVGTVMNQVLEEENLPITEYIPVASEKSVGKTITFNGKKLYHCLYGGGSGNEA